MSKDTCGDCPIYLVCGGSIRELNFEQTGVCKHRNELVQKGEFAPPTFWNTQTIYTCDCGYVMTDGNHKMTFIKYCDQLGCQMVYFRCPQCGTASILI